MNKSAIDKRELTHDRLGDTFDDVMNAYDIERRLAVLIDEFLLDVDLDRRLVLDAGCGSGRGTARLTEKGATVISVDIGMNLLQYTRKNYHCQPALTSILNMPFADNTFDIVFSSEVIEHTPDPMQAVQEMVRVLKSGGRLVLSTPNKLWETPVRVASMLKLRPYDGLENFISPITLRQGLTAQHGKVIAHQGIHLFPFQLTPLHPLLRMLDDYGNALLPLMINQAILFIKD